MKCIGDISQALSFRYVRSRTELEDIDDYASIRMRRRVAI
jgi:hypothetical protein